MAERSMKITISAGGR